MSVGVVHALEMIEIDQHDPHWKAVPGGAAELACGPVFIGAAIRETREGIGERQLLQKPVLRFDLPVEMSISLRPT